MANPASTHQVDDFDLQLRPARDGAYEAAVLRSPAGEVRRTFTLPLPAGAIETQQQQVEATLRYPLDHDATVASTLGGMLFASVFADGVLQAYDQSLGLARSHARDLRIRLRVLDDALLAALPWELLYDARNQAFVALQPDTILIRTLETLQPRKPSTGAAPLRILAMAAQPSDLDALDVARECQHLEDALHRLGDDAVLHWVAGQTWRDLHDALQRGTWHVVHFLGHGHFDRHTGSGFLAFADEQGAADLRSGAELAQLLGGHDALRLVVLNACASGQGDSSHIDAGIAHHLVRAGVPAVLALQYAITDAAATELARSFYSALSNDLPIDAAFAEARHALSLALPETLAWAVPVLVTRGGDSQLSAKDERKRWDGRNPYRGLEPFQEHDAEFFFGRDRLVDELLVRLADARFICVAGPSGSGKSSLVQAGLLHALKQGRLAKSAHWLYAMLSPTADPLAELCSAVARVAKTPAAAAYLRQHAAQDVSALCAQVETLLSHDRQQRFVLYIDQFEELFTQTKDEQERIAFLGQLTTAAEKVNSRIIIIISIRSDFLSQCAAYPALRELINRQFFLVGEMQPDELEQTIVQPALAVGAGVEPALIDKIIAEMEGEPGALPLMEFALRDLFESETQKRQLGDTVKLTLAGYTQRGGIRKALRRHADRVFATLTPEQQTLARPMFTFLVEVGIGAQPARRTVTLEALRHLGRPEDVDAVVHALADARLLTTSSPANGEAGMVTVAHERLLSSWPWLEKLIDENRETIYLQNIIARDAADWERNAQDASFLYSGARLAAVRERIIGSGLLLPELPNQFVQTAMAAEDKRLADRQRAVRRQLRRRNWLIGTLGALLTVILLLVGRNAYMARLQQASPWQPVESFPKDWVYSVAYSPGASPGQSYYCVGTVNLGIGCNYDGKGWNLYQSLPTGLAYEGGVGAFSGSVRGITGLSIDTSNPTIILAYSMSGAIYRSANRGMTWEPTVGSIPANSAAQISINGKYAAAVIWRPATDDGHTLYFSIDGGSHWANAEQSGSHGLGRINDVLIDRRGAYIFVATEGGIYRAPLAEKLDWALYAVNWPVSILLENADGCCLLAIGQSQSDDSWSVYSISQGNLVRSIYTTPKPPLDASVDPLRPDADRLFLLMRSGEVVVIDGSGSVSELGSVFGGRAAFSIVAVPDKQTGKTQLLLAHFDGLYTHTTQFE